MQVTLHRTIATDKSTIGELFVDGVFECFTLEDVVRDVKIFGETAIPAGTYEVILNHSPRFGKIMPRLLEVPNFTGILIHKGNTPENTHGCILVGKDRTEDRILHSTEAYNTLFTKLWDAIKVNGQQAHITITNNF
jgi:hypothetical protein